jgi:hypothetical protein
MNNSKLLLITFSFLLSASASTSVFAGDTSSCTENAFDTCKKALMYGVMETLEKKTNKKHAGERARNIKSSYGKRLNVCTEVALGCVNKIIPGNKNSTIAK